MQTSIGNTTGYVNYVYNLQAKGTAQVTSQIMGMSGLVGSTLGQLAFQTSAYLSEAESVAMSFGMVATAGLYKATKQAMKFDYAMQGVQAIAGQNNIGNLGEQAMAMSNKFGVAVDQMIEGLESLARAGVSPANMQGILEQAMGLSKLEAIDLNTAINDLISTTNLLDTQGLDLESPEYVEAVKYQNQKITATSEAAPINAQDIIHTLEHVGGYASSTNLDQDDLYAVIAQLGSKGTKSEIAGTSLRAFLAAGQKDTAQRALDRIGLKVSDLWKNDEQILSISDMKDVLDEAMEAKGYTKQEKLEFYSDFAGYKQANQIMKIDTKSVREFKEKIDRSWDVGKKVETVLQTTEAHLQSILQMGTNMLTTVGEPIMKVANVALVPLKMIMGAFDFIVSKVPGMKWVAAGTLMMVALKGISTVFNKVVPSLGLMVLNFGNVSSYAKDTRDALAESAKIIHTLSGGSSNREAIVDIERDRILSRISNEDYLNYFVKHNKINKKGKSRKELDDIVFYQKSKMDFDAQKKMEEEIIRDKTKRFNENNQLYSEPEEKKKSNAEIQEERNNILSHLIGGVSQLKNSFENYTKQHTEEKKANSDGQDKIDTLSKEVININSSLSDISKNMQNGITIKDFNTNQIIDSFSDIISSLKDNVYTVRLEQNDVKFTSDIDFNLDILDTINSSLKEGFENVVEAINNCCIGRSKKTKTSSSKTPVINVVPGESQTTLVIGSKGEKNTEVKVDNIYENFTDKGSKDMDQAIIDLGPMFDAITEEINKEESSSKKKKIKFKLREFKGKKVDEIANLNSKDRKKALTQINKWLSSVQKDVEAMRDEFETEQGFLEFAAEQYYEAFSKINIYNVDSLLASGLFNPNVKDVLAKNAFTDKFIKMQDVIRKTKRFNNADARRILEGGIKFNAIRQYGPKGAAMYIQPYTVEKTNDDFGTIDRREYNASDYERDLKGADLTHKKITNIKYSNEANSVGSFKYKNNIGEYEDYNAIDIIPNQMIIEVADEVSGELYKLIQDNANKLVYFQQQGEKTKIPMHHDGTLMSIQEIENKINRLSNVLELEAIKTANILEKGKRQPKKIDKLDNMVEGLSKSFIRLFSTGLTDEEGNILTSINVLNGNDELETLNIRDKITGGNTADTREGFRSLLKHNDFAARAIPALNSFFNNEKVQFLFDTDERHGDNKLFDRFKDDKNLKKFIKDDLLSTIYNMYLMGPDVLEQAYNASLQVERNPLKDIKQQVKNIHKDVADYASDEGTEESSYDDVYSFTGYGDENNVFFDASYNKYDNVRTDDVLINDAEEPITKVYINNATDALKDALAANPNLTVANLHKIKADYGITASKILAMIAELDRQHKLLTEIQYLAENGEIPLDNINIKDGNVDLSTIKLKNIRDILGRLLHEPMSSIHITPGTVEGKNQTFGLLDPDKDPLLQTIQDARAVKSSFDNELPYIESYSDIQYNKPNDDTDYTPTVVKKPSLMSVFRSSILPDIVSASKATPGAGAQEEGWRTYYITTKDGIYSYQAKAEEMVEIPEGKVHSSKLKGADQAEIQSRISNETLGEKALEYIKIGNEIEKREKDITKRREQIEKAFNNGELDINRYTQILENIDADQLENEKIIENLKKEQQKINDSVMSMSKDFNFEISDDLETAINLGVGKGDEIISGLFVRTASVLREIHNGDPFVRNKNGEIIGILQDSHKRFSEIYTKELEMKRFSERLKSKNRLNAGFLAGNFGFSQNDIKNMKLSANISQSLEQQYSKQSFKGVDLDKYKEDQSYKKQIDDMYNRMRIMNYSSTGDPNNLDKNLFTKEVNEKEFMELKRRNMLLPQDIATHMENGLLKGGKNGTYEIFDLSLLEYNKKDLRNAAVINLLSRDLMLQEKTALMGDEQWKGLTLDEVFNVDQDGVIYPSHKSSLFLFDVMNKGFENHGIELRNFIDKNDNKNRFMANMINNPELLKTLKEQSQIRVKENISNIMELVNIIDRYEQGEWLSSEELEKYNKQDRLFNVYETGLDIEKELSDIFTEIDDLSFIRAQYINDPRFLEQLENAKIIEKASKYESLEDYIHQKVKKSEEKIKEETTAQNDEQIRRKKIDTEISNKIWQPFDDLFKGPEGRTLFGEKYFKELSSVDDLKDFILTQKMHKGRQKHEENPEGTIIDFFERNDNLKDYIYQIFRRNTTENDREIDIKDVHKIADSWMNEHNTWEQLYFIYEYFLNAQKMYTEHDIVPVDMRKVLRLDEKRQRIKELTKNFDAIRENKMLKFLGIDSIKDIDDVDDEDKLSTVIQNIEKNALGNAMKTRFSQNIKSLKESNLGNMNTFDTILNKKSISNEDKINLIRKLFIQNDENNRLSQMNDIFSMLTANEQKDMLNAFSSNSLLQQGLLAAMNNQDIEINNIDPDILYENARELSPLFGLIYSYGTFADNDIAKSRYKMDGKHGKKGDLKLNKNSDIWNNEEYSELRYLYFSLLNQRKQLEYLGVDELFPWVNDKIKIIETLNAKNSQQSRIREDPKYKELQEKSLIIDDLVRTGFVYDDLYVKHDKNPFSYAQEKVEKIEAVTNSSLLYGENAQKINHIKKLIDFAKNPGKYVNDKDRKKIAQELEDYAGNFPVEDQIEKLEKDLGMLQEPILKQVTQQSKIYTDQIIEKYFSTPWEVFYNEAIEEMRNKNPELETRNLDAFIEEVENLAQNNFMNNTIEGLSALKNIFPFLDQSRESLFTNIPKENMALNFSWLMSEEEFNTAQANHIPLHFSSYEEYVNHYKNLFNGVENKNTSKREPVEPISDETIVNAVNGYDNKEVKNNAKKTGATIVDEIINETVKNVNEGVNESTTIKNKKSIPKSAQYNQIVDWIDKYKTMFSNAFKEATIKVFGSSNDEGFKQSFLFKNLDYNLQAEKLNYASNSLQKNITFLTRWREALLQVAGDSNLLQVPLDTLALGLTSLIMGMKTISKISSFLLSIVDHAQKLQRDGKTKILNTTIKENSGAGNIISSVGGAIEPLGDKIDDFLVTHILPLTPYLLGLGATIYGVKVALDLSYASHKKYLQQLQDEEKENKSKSKALKISTEQSKKANDQYKYMLNKQKLDNANLTRLTGAIKLSEAKNDTLWGQYGIASALDKMQGKYESTASEYDGTSGQIRRIKEHTTGGQGFIRGLPGYYSQAEEMVAAYYDANKLAIGVMDEYKDELGELYDAETNAMRKNPENPRETKIFQDALDKFVEATGITREHAQQYLDYMQTEHNVDNAVQAMQAQADTIMARTDMQIQAIAFGGNPADVLGLNGIESQQNAMVQAQADMIKLETSSQLWWKAVWSTITSPVRALFAPIFSIAHILGAIWATITGNWNAAGMHMQQAGASLNVLGESATYWGAWGNVESTDFNAIGQGAINENDRADYGNAATASGSRRRHVPSQRDNSIFGFLPVGWPNGLSKTNKTHGVKEHQEQLAKNAQESFFGKLIGGITSILGTIANILVIAFVAKGIKIAWDSNIVQNTIGKITNHLPGIKTGLEKFVKNHPKVKKVLDYGRSAANILGITKAKDFIAQYIPQNWKDTWSELWTEKEENIDEEEVNKDKPIEENVGSIRENVANIWAWLKDLFTPSTKENKKKEEDVTKQLPGGNVPLLGPGPIEKEYNTYYDPYDEEISKKIHLGYYTGLGSDSQIYAAVELEKIKNQNLERYNNIIEDAKIIPTADNMENQLERFLLHGNFKISQQAISDDAVGESLSGVRRVLLSPDYLKEFSSFDDNKVQSTIWHELVHTMLQHGERHQGKMQIDENDPVYKEGLNTPHVHRASELEAYLGSLLTQYKMAGYDVSARDLFDNFDDYSNQENLPIHLQQEMARIKGRITWFKNYRSDDVDNISFDMLDSLSDVFVENKDVIMSKLRSEAMLDPEFINIFGNSEAAGEFEPNMMNTVSINNKVAKILSTFANGSKDSRSQYEALYANTNPNFKGIEIDSTWGQDKMASGLQAHYMFTHQGAFSNALFRGQVNPWDIITTQYDKKTGEEIPITYGDFANYLSYAINHSEGLWENSILYHGGGPLHEDENSNLGSIHKIMSTSFSHDVAESFKTQHQNGVNVKMYAPMGTKGLYTNTVNEDEYTIDEGQRFITLSRDELNRPTEVLLLTQEFLDQLGITEEALNQAVSQGFDLKGVIAANNFNTNTNQKAMSLVGDISNTNIEEDFSIPTLPIMSLTQPNKTSWSEYLSTKIGGYADPWKQYFSDKTQSFKDSITSGIVNPEDKNAFYKKKRRGMTKEDRKYLNEEYNLGFNLDDFKTAKQANKAIRNKLDETGQWDNAVNDLYLKDKGGYRGLLKENYLDPWTKYGKDKAKEKYDDLMIDAYAYRERPDMFEDASTPVKWLAKGLDLKDKYLGSGFGGGLDIEKIQEALKDPEVMEELLKEQLDSIDSDSPLGQYRDKIYKAHEIATDPEKAITWAQNKYGKAIDMGSEEYEWYQGGEIDYKDLSWANQIRSIKENTLGMESDESILQVLQDPERTIDMAKDLYGAYKNGDLEGTFNLDNVDVYQNIKEKMAGIFNKEDIEEAIEDGIDDGTDGKGGGGLFGSIKKLFGFGEEDTSPITKEEMEENEKKGEFETIPEWKERYLKDLHKPSLSEGIKDRLHNIFGSEEETPMSNIGKFMNMDIESKHALMTSGLSTNGIMGGTFMESTPGGIETSESILPLNEDDSILPEINGENISKGGKAISKIGNKLAGKGGKLGKLGKGMSKMGGSISKAGSKGIGGMAKGGISKLGKTGIGKTGGKLMSKVGGKIAGKVGGKIMGKVGAQVASKVLGGALMATGIGAPLGLLLESPLGGMLIEGAMNLGGKALGAVGSAVGGVGKALFGSRHAGGKKGLLNGLMAASPLGIMASAFGGGGPRNIGKVAAPLGGMIGILGQIFTNNKETKNLNQKMEAHAGKTLEAVREQNAKTTPNSNSSGGNITIQNININTQDDPEAIKAMFLELIVELQEQVSPRLVSRTAGKASNGSNSTQDSSTDTSSTEQTNTPNTDANGNITSNRGH